MVRRAVLGRKSSPIHAEYHGQILQSSVMNNAVVGSLQESRVNGANRVEAHRGHAASKQNRVLFRDPDVIITVGHGLFEKLEARSAWHCSRDTDDSVVLLTELHHGLPKNILPVRSRSGLRRKRRTGCDIIRPKPMKLFRV